MIRLAFLFVCLQGMLSTAGLLYSPPNIWFMGTGDFCVVEQFAQELERSRGLLDGVIGVGS